MTNQTPCNAPMTRSDEPQTWHEDEIDSISTMSCRTVAAIRAIDAEDPKTALEEPLAAWLAGDDWLARIRQVGVQAQIFGRVEALRWEVGNSERGTGPEAGGAWSGSKLPGLLIQLAELRVAVNAARRCRDRPRGAGAWRALVAGVGLSLAHGCGLSSFGALLGAQIDSKPG